jgi:phage terminase large subunit-like protein
MRSCYVKSDPWLSARLVVREHEGVIARADGFGSLHRVSADSGALSGYTPSLVVADELADWTTPRRRRAWSALATAGQVARSQVHVFAISTAGEPAERVDGILGQLIDRNELEGESRLRRLV